MKKKKQKYMRCTCTIEQRILINGNLLSTLPDDHFLIYTPIFSTYTPQIYAINYY